MERVPNEVLRNDNRGPSRPAIAHKIRDLIRQMSKANPLWGAPRIYGELLKLGIGVGQTAVSKCMTAALGNPVDSSADRVFDGTGR